MSWFKLLVVLVEVIRQFLAQRKEDKLIKAGKALQFKETEEDTNELVKDIKDAQSKLTPDQLSLLLLPPAERAKLAQGSLRDNKPNVSEDGAK